MGGPAESHAGMPENPVDRRAYWGLARKGRFPVRLKRRAQLLQGSLQSLLVFLFLCNLVNSTVTPVSSSYSGKISSAELTHG